MSVTVGTTSAQTPQQSNFGGLKAQVAAYVQGQNQPSILADAGMAINSAIDHLNTRNWNWLLKQQTITLVASTATYTVNANFKRPRKLTKLDTNSKVVGWFDYQIPKAFLNANWGDVNDGDPWVYTVRNASDDRLLTFNVPPSSDFVTNAPTARLDYFARAQHFGADGDTMGTLEIPPEVKNYLVWYARWEIASMRGDAGQIRAAENSWQRAWKHIAMDDRDEQTDWSVGGSYQ